MIDALGMVIGSLMTIFIILLPVSYFTDKFILLQKTIGWSMLLLMVLGAIFLK